MNRFLHIIFLCWISAFPLVTEAQQTVTGRVTDATDGTPIPDVNIYIANTTIGTTSDESGNYSITVPTEGSFEIVASHVGYQHVFHKVDAPKSFHQIDFVLEINEISEVSITARSIHSKKDVDFFWRGLLGVKPSKYGMEVLNPEKVYYFRNRDSVLKVSCKEPIEIVNHHMGYRIRYMLQSFEHDYRSGENTFFGMPFFEELTPRNNRQKRQWEKIRQDVYDVSITRFIRALYRGQIHEEGFLLTKKDSIEYVGYGKTAFPLEDILQTTQEGIQVNIESPLLLACFSEPVTELMIENTYAALFYYVRKVPIMVLKPQQITIYSDGTYTGLLNLQNYRKSILGLSAMLPIEYANKQSFDDHQSIEHDTDGESEKVSPFIDAFQKFSENIPQEKVYLHFDNTSYYQGDHIWFKCYVTSAQHQLSQLSKTLYVELLNPGGEIVDKRILKVENGQCHGDFTLDHLPFYSGFYEVRAYTKYMLNFGDDIIFSRLLPVFDKPKIEGNFEEKKMLKYTRWGIGDYPMKRERPEKEKKVNLRFFPEGGNLIQGVASRVAFEATDEIGNPIDVSGVVMDAARQELCSFASTHEGRGVFTYTPTGAAGRRKDVAVVDYLGKKYQFDLPSGLLWGVVMEVDNLSHSDSIAITLRKNIATLPEILGVAILNGGCLQSVYFANMEEDESHYLIDKTLFPSGISQIVLFNSKGEILCDRLIFTNLNQLLNSELLDIKAKTGKPVYRPHELVDMELSVADREANPVSATFSLSVRDGENEVERKQNILTDLLLMSEIKGYVRNPAYYFEGKNDTVETRRATSLLDVLLMVQGWRRYSWNQIAGIEEFEIKNLPEQGIETHGNVVSFVKQKPQPNVDVSMMLIKKGDENESGGSFVETFITDDQGRFSFALDVTGKWSMILSVTEKGKKKDHKILLDRVFSPEPKKYRYADLQVNIAEKTGENLNNEEKTDQPDDDSEAFLTAYRDSIAKLGIDEKVHQIKEVTIKGKRNTKEQDIVRNRSTSVTYYDVPAEMDNFFDQGKYIGEDIHEFMKSMNEDFTIRHPGYSKIFKDDETLEYKKKMPFFIINYKPVVIYVDVPGEYEFEYFKYKSIRVNAIKSIYINETPSAICQYVTLISGLNGAVPCSDLLKDYSCIVFIETYPEGQIPVKGAKGVRKTWLEGYSAVSEFYSPDYSKLPPEPNDYRRTLYWNPLVSTDENGKAKIEFYNNSRCTNFSISAETVTEEGRIGVYRDE